MKQQNSPLRPLEYDVSRLPEKGRTIKFCASESEREKVCSAFDLLSLDNLEARLKLSRWRKDGVSVRGNIVASLTLPCVVSLVPVRQDIDDEVDVLFVLEGSPLATPHLDANGEMIIDPEGRELPETFEGDSIRFDEVILEALTLAIDPYPRTPGVEIPEDFFSPDDQSTLNPSPFSVLAKLKDGGGDY